jgi:hypothetical protein
VESNARLTNSQAAILGQNFEEVPIKNFSGNLSRNDDLDQLPMNMTIAEYEGVTNNIRDAGKNKSLTNDPYMHNRIDEMQDKMNILLKALPDLLGKGDRGGPARKTGSRQGSQPRNPRKLPSEHQYDSHRNTNLKKQFQNDNYSQSGPWANHDSVGGIGHDLARAEKERSKTPNRSGPEQNPNSISLNNSQNLEFPRSVASSHGQQQNITAPIGPKSKYIFTSDDLGMMRQWSIDEKKLVHDWGCIHEGGVHLITATRSGKFVFTASWFGHLKQWSVTQKCLVKDYKKIHKGFINN